MPLLVTGSHIAHPLGQGQPDCSQPHRPISNPAPAPAATSLQPSHLLPPAQSTSSPSPLLPHIHLCTFFSSQTSHFQWSEVCPLQKTSPFLLPLLCFQGTANNFTPTSLISHTQEPCGDGRLIHPLMPDEELAIASSQEFAAKHTLCWPVPVDNPWLLSPHLILDVQ